jgi:hypothetical protein
MVVTYNLQPITVPKARTKNYHFWLFLIVSKELPVSHSVLHGLSRKLDESSGIIHAQLVIERKSQKYFILDALAEVALWSINSG